MNAYLLDSNYWITAKYYYPIDVFPSFWDSMKTLIESESAIIHQTVMEEINRKEDEISSWLQSEVGVETMPISENAFTKYLEICRWAENESQGYTREAIAEFEQNSRADAWLCAEAAVSGLILVTDEKKSNSPNKVKIPNACEAFGAECISNIDFMRANGFSF